jgi:ribosomal protein S18 acetylase RimI-like enzyme
LHNLEAVDGCQERVEICWGLPDGFRREAASIYYEAFAQKMRPIIGSQEQGIPILERTFDAEMAIVTLKRGRLVGLAGLMYEGRCFFDPAFSDLVREFGLLGGLARAVVLGFLSSHSRDGALYLDDLAVDTAMRGQGIGTRLLQAVFDFAQERDMPAVRLDVVDTNPGARRLYERLGFVAVRTRRCPLLFRQMGFSAFTTMVKEIGDGMLAHSICNT